MDLWQQIRSLEKKHYRTHEGMVRNGMKVLMTSCPALSFRCCDKFNLWGLVGCHGSCPPDYLIEELTLCVKYQAHPNSTQFSPSRVICFFFSVIGFFSFFSLSVRLQVKTEGSKFGSAACKRVRNPPGYHRGIRAVSQRQFCHLAVLYSLIEGRC